MIKKITKQQKRRNGLKAKGKKETTLTIRIEHDEFFKFLAEASRDGKL